MLSGFTIQTPQWVPIFSNGIALAAMLTFATTCSEAHALKFIETFVRTLGEIRPLLVRLVILLANSPLGEAASFPGRLT